MKYNFLFIIFFALGSLIFSGCGNDDDDDIGDAPCSTTWALAVQDEAEVWTTAAQAYGANPTTENCNAYKVAAQAYLNALEPFDNCATLTGQQRAEWNAALDAAQESINNMDCQ